MQNAAQDLVQFCQNYTGFLLTMGQIFVVGSLLAVILLLVVQVIAASKGPGPAPRGVAAVDVLAALTSLIDSLSKAPIWLAMLAGGLGMMWLSAHAKLETCPKAISAQHQ